MLRKTLARGKNSDAQGLVGIIVKITILPKIIYRVIVIPTKIFIAFFTEIEQKY